MYSDLEKKITELEGIFSCRITGEKGIDEVHIVASNDREPKRIVRDVETMVLVNLDQEIDHKKISIAQISGSGEEVSENRVEINSIFRENNRPVCYLRLNINGDSVEEKIEGLVEEPIYMTVAKGMVETIQKHTSFNGRIRVENVFKTGINDEIVIVQLILYKNTNSSEEERLIGATYINNDLLLAAGKATLKAVNRLLHNYL